jgi:extracellular elastinolytic metalloproteinase
MNEFDIRQPTILIRTRDAKPGLQLVRYVSASQPDEPDAVGLANGNAHFIRASETKSSEADYREFAVRYCRELSTLELGQEANRFEFVADPVLQRTSSGAISVSVQQFHRGIPIFQAAQTVCFGPDGRVWGVSGTQVNEAPPEQIEAAVSAVDALQHAVRFIIENSKAEKRDAPRDAFGQERIEDPIPRPTSDNSEGDEPVVLASLSDKPDCSAILDMRGLGDVVPARLVWFPLDGTLHLAWQLVITTARRSHQYRILVEAAKGTVVYCKDLVRHVAARGIVFFPDGNSTPVHANFPEPLSKYHLPLPPDLAKEFPQDWVLSGNTSGRYVRAQRHDEKVLEGQQSGGVIVFCPDSIADCGVLNLFYLCSYLHDFFYLLGCKVEAGDVQCFARGGESNIAPLMATLHSESLDGTTSFFMPADGSAPVISFGRFHATGHHTALDATVVFHEYSHMVTSRLVGGPFNEWALEAPQSEGMAEGWSDYFACSASDKNVIGSWVSGRPDGIRGYPYDDNFPDDFGKLGTGRYAGRTGNRSACPHPIGEIWCAALLEINRKIGKPLALQLVVDGLKLAPANPSFSQGRDAIVLALQAMFEAGRLDTEEYYRAWSWIWNVFARFGMGRKAESLGPTLKGIVADFEEPPFPGTPGQNDEVVKVVGSPDVTIPDGQLPGIEHALQVKNAGWIRKISVWVEITHPFMGDLQVDLVTPQLTVLNLHNRTGRGSSQLRQTWGSAQGQPLNSLIGQAAAGNWVLRVMDHKTPDSGKLRRWGLEIVLTRAKSIYYEWRGPMRIPAGDALGVMAPIEITSDGKIESLKVLVDIAHTRLQDVGMTLISPHGARTMLHTQHTSGAQSLMKTWDLRELTGIRRKLINQPMAGVWRLQVRDLAPGETGALNRWSLEISARHHSP